MGLHSNDVRKRFDVLHALVDQGNTVVVIEHNLAVIKTADWVIDLSPEGGDKGGEIVAEATPEAVAQVARSHTGGIRSRCSATGGRMSQLVRSGKPTKAPCHGNYKPQDTIIN